MATAAAVSAPVRQTATAPVTQPPPQAATPPPPPSTHNQAPSAPSSRLSAAPVFTTQPRVPQQPALAPAPPRTQVPALAVPASAPPVNLATEPPAAGAPGEGAIDRTAGLLDEQLALVDSPSLPAISVPTLPPLVGDTITLAGGPLSLLSGSLPGNPVGSVTVPCLVSACDLGEAIAGRAEVSASTSKVLALASGIVQLSAAGLHLTIVLRPAKLVSSLEAAAAGSILSRDALSALLGAVSSRLAPSGPAGPSDASGFGLFGSAGSGSGGFVLDGFQDLVSALGWRSLRPASTVQPAGIVLSNLAPPG